MKKMILAALFVAGMGVMNAQITKEQMQASDARMQKLVKLVEKEPKQTGVADVDTYVSETYEASVQSNSITDVLQNLYYRQIGESKDGIADVNVKKPSIEELKDLSGKIMNQADTVKGLADAAKQATSSASSVKNPMKAAKIASALGFTKDAYPILAEESVLQVKAITEMIKTATTANNL